MRKDTYVNKLKYKNKQGIDFDIEFLTTDVPSGADFFGFLIDVIANTDPITHHTYKAIVKKICVRAKKALVCGSTQPRLNSYMRFWTHTKTAEPYYCCLRQWANGSFCRHLFGFQPARQDGAVKGSPSRAFMCTFYAVFCIDL